MFEMTFALRFETVCSSMWMFPIAAESDVASVWETTIMCKDEAHVRLFSLGILDKLHVPKPYNFSLKHLQSLGLSINSFLLWDQKVNSTLPLDPTLRQLKPVQTFLTTSSNISFNNTLTPVPVAARSKA